jgi:RimJ/RimL family protein N-acetyltransferase
VHAARLTLLVPDLSVLDAAVDGTVALSRALGGCEVAADWAGFPEALPAVRDAVAEDPESARWGTRLFILEQPRTLVGWGGFKGRPVEGVVELGYSIAPDFRGRGIAGDAVRKMLREAFSSGEVSAVIAHTRPAAGPSTRVLEKSGFVRDGEVEDADGQLWRWRRMRGAGAA